MEDDHKTKTISKKNPSRSIISLKDIPPLDPSSIPLINSSLKPRRTMMVPVYVAKQEKLKMVNEVEEDNVNSSFSNIQIDPNSTRSKKAAAEHAAEGALWYLDHVGETKESRVSKSSSRQMK
ncbi:unnamed protein product [Arabis nemorensis]|uniref:Uncharacterized protein n=1 Tax=Arabis nemorensis TaxID=586526 RepID=A0A565B2H9_9BRAS|nr:unnamed protein product [Arabis nemorensis]